MIPGRQRRIRAGNLMQGRIRGLFAPLCAAVMLAGAAQAQSAFGCRNLETHAALPAVEGADGTFFSILPEMQSHHALTEETIARIVALSNALEARGTTLLLLPVPTRAQVLAHLLPPMARHVGYDADISTTVHQEMIRRMKRAGLNVADVRQPLRQAALAGEQVFFQTDMRPTPAGARVMGQVIAQVLAELPGTRNLPRGTFSSEDVGEVTLSSAMRAQLQLGCQDALPQVRAGMQRTVGSISVNNVSILGLIGTEVSATTELNLAGYISEYSGLRSGSYGVPGGGAYAAMSSFLTAREFETQAPTVLVWEFPVSAPFGLQGDQPLRELTAAAAGRCTQTLPLLTGDNSSRLTAALTGLPNDRPVTLALDTDGVAVSQALFHFTGADGKTRTRGIWRHPGQVLTGRFFLPLSGLQASGLDRVEIELPAAFGPQPRLRACLEDPR